MAVALYLVMKDQCPIYHIGAREHTTVRNAEQRYRAELSRYERGQQTANGIDCEINQAAGIMEIGRRMETIQIDTSQCASCKARVIGRLVREADVIEE